MQDTFLRVFALLDPDEFRLAFVAWVEGLRAPGDGQVLTVDGKALRHAFSAAAGKLKVHMVSARTSHAAETFAIVRHVALNLLKKEKSRKGGIASRRKLCGWDHGYLLLVMGLGSGAGGS